MKLDKYIGESERKTQSTLKKYIPEDLLNSDLDYILEEPIPRYQKVWNNLMKDRLKSNFSLEFKKKNEIFDFKELFKSKKEFDIDKAINVCKKVQWREQPYDKQHWGNWLHSLSPYQGRLTPSFAHWLVRIFSTKDMVVFDPFCGVGTVPLEADFLGRSAIGNDLNPYAYLVAKGKFDRRPIDEHLNYLKNISVDVVSNPFRNFINSTVIIDDIDRYVF
jgi:DNA modification methylase